MDEQKKGWSEVNKLEISSQALKTRKSIKKVLFSKQGFDFIEATDTILFDPQRI